MIRNVDSVVVILIGVVELIDWWVIMDPEASSSSRCDLYSSLPSLVSAVGNRIGLDRSCDGRGNRGNVDKFIRDSVPQFDSQGMKFKFYFLDDIHPIFKKKSRENNSGQRLTSAERRKLFTIDKNSKLEYKTFEKINCLWNQYMSNIVKGNPKDIGLRLAKADYHGAKIAVLAACNPSLVGCVGYVVQESKNTFKIIDKTNKILGKKVRNYNQNTSSLPLICPLHSYTEGWGTFLICS